MIIKTSDIKELCIKISSAIDTADIVALTDLIELIVQDNNLYLNITNKEYYIRAKVPINVDVDFHAVVNATLFLKLIANMTTETIELNVDDSVLTVIGNGKYKFPLIYDKDKIIDLPVLEIYNCTSRFDIQNSILQSILTYNSKEFSKSVATNIVQNYYYVDEYGAITFRKGACVTKFNLDSPIKILLPQKIVKLFKLFKDDTVKFSLGYDKISDDIIQTKVKFETSDIILTAITSSDDALVDTVPVKIIRDRAYNLPYEYNIILNKNLLLDTIKRLSLFSSNDISKMYGKFVFLSDKVIVSDCNDDNSEVVPYLKDVKNINYTAVVEFDDLKMALEKCNSPSVNIGFGNSQAMSLSFNNVYFVIQEVNY